MTNYGYEEQEGDGVQVFIGEDDILHEIPIDDEDLPDADEDMGSDLDEEDEQDDSIHIFEGHTDEVYTVACSPTDATLVATGGGDGKGFLWRKGQGDWFQQLGGHEESVSSLSFSKDGQLLATGGLDGVVQVWDMPSGSLKCKLEGPGKGIVWVKWHPREERHFVLAGAEDGSVWLWDTDCNALSKIFSYPASRVTCGDFTPDGKVVCIGYRDASLRIWNLETGEKMHVVNGDRFHTKGLTYLVVSSDSGRVITGSKDGSVRMVNIKTGKVINSLFCHSGSVEYIGLSPGYPMVATCGLDQKLIIWDLECSMARCICNHESGVTCLAWLGSSRFLATGGLDGNVRVWDSRSGECRRIFYGHSEAIFSISLSANLDFLVSVSQDHSARVFEILEFNSTI